jgi:Glycosyl hydrolases family 28
LFAPGYTFIGTHLSAIHDESAIMGGSLFSQPGKPGKGRFLAAAAAVALIVLQLCWIAILAWRQHFIAAHSCDYDVYEFGAKSNGVANDTAAVQAAIDLAAARGGGVVVFPAGRYLSGTLHLRSNVSLRLSEGAVLIASPDDADFDPYEAPPSGSISPNPISWAFANKFRHREVSRYGLRILHETVDNPDTTYAHYSLIVGDHVSNVTIEGPGTIDGNRTQRGGPKLIALKNCRHITIRGLTLRNAPSYNISLIGSEDADLENLRIINGYADGIDPDNSRFVRIANCYIDTWDDAICAKASLALGRRLATENLVVTNCILRTSNAGFKFGTESEGGLRDVSLTNCVVMRRDFGRRPNTGIAIESVDGGKVNNVVISNVVMRGVYTPVFLRLGNRGRGMIEPRPGEMRNISISNVMVLDSMEPSSITGLPGFPIHDVTLSNFIVSEAGAGIFAGLEVPELPRIYPFGGMFGLLPAYSLYARHVDGLSISNWRARWQLPDARPAAVFDDVSNLQVVGFRAAAVGGQKAVILLNHVSKTLMEAVTAAHESAVRNGPDLGEHQPGNRRPVTAF